MKKIFLAVSLFFISNFVYAIPSLIIDSNGELTGARDVDVNGNMYDVDFQDGTCASLFGGCDDAGDLALSASDVDAATAALFSSVFVDSLDGNFDSDPSLTMGCETPTLCSIITAGYFLADPFDPDSMDVVFSIGSNSDEEQLDDIIAPYTTDISAGGDINTSAFDVSVFAVWSVATSSSVPEPSILGLMFIGLAGISLRLSKNT